MALLECDTYIVYKLSLPKENVTEVARIVTLYYKKNYITILKYFHLKYLANWSISDCTDMRVRVAKNVHNMPRHANGDTHRLL
jgi:hypothetical protein